MRSGKCPKCGSEQIVDGGRIVEDGEVRLRFLKHKRVLFPGPVVSEIRAIVCVDCGYTELYAIQPEVFNCFIKNEEQ